MRLLNVQTFALESFADHTTAPEYAILSHTWGDDEVLFQDVQPVTDTTKLKHGWKKIEYTCHQALKDGLKYAWVDTCCIDKSSSAELSEAINSMFAWYKESEVCYVYLADVGPGEERDEIRETASTSAAEERESTFANNAAGVPCSQGNATTQQGCEPSRPIGAREHASTSASCRAGAADSKASTKDETSSPPDFDDVASLSVGETDPPSTVSDNDCNNVSFADHFKASRWFTRGWTLQELLAPKRIEFCSARWNLLGSLEDRATEVAAVTSIPRPALYREVPMTSYSVAQRMSWAANRITTRLEDQAYCLLGLFQVNMPLLYGERHKAFERLQKEILRTSGDLSILAWEHHSFSMPGKDSLMAESPAAFASSGRFRTIGLSYRPSVSLTPSGLQAFLPVASTGRGAVSKTTFYVALNCYDERFPTKPLALATTSTGWVKRADNKDTTVALLPPRLSPEMPTRLFLLHCAEKAKSIKFTLSYDAGDRGNLTAPLYYLRLFDTSPHRQYQAKITDLYPLYRWNKSSMFYELRHSADDRLVLPNDGDPPIAGFTLRLEPRVLSPAKPSSSVANWRIEVEWTDSCSNNRSRDFVLPSSFTVRCHNETEGEEQAHCHSPGTYEPCDGCRRSECSLFTVVRPLKSFRSEENVSLIFKGLGRGNQLRFNWNSRLLKDPFQEFGDYALDIVLERLPRPIWADAQRYSGVAADLLFWSMLASAIVVGYTCFQLSRRTRVASDSVESFFEYEERAVIASDQQSSSELPSMHREPQQQRRRNDLRSVFEMTRNFVRIHY